jgi:hypothetical protein
MSAGGNKCSGCALCKVRMSDGTWEYKLPCESELIGRLAIARAEGEAHIIAGLLIAIARIERKLDLLAQELVIKGEIH